MNSLLSQLATERESRKRPADGSPPARPAPPPPRPPPASSSSTKPSTKPPSTPSSVVVDLCDDSESDSEAASLALARKLSSPPSSDDAASLALARELQQQDAQQGAASLAASLTLARQLQQQSAPPGSSPGSFRVTLTPGSAAYFSELRRQSDQHRRQCEGPPSAEPYIVTSPDGTKQRLRGASQGWLENSPVVSSSDLDALAQLADLGCPPPPGGRVCANPANRLLLLLLCSWRQHVRNTRLETQAPGSTKWSSCSICTSEMTWLGRKAEKKGIIPMVATTSTAVDSIESLLELGAAATSASFAMLVWMRLNRAGGMGEGGILSTAAIAVFERHLKKAKETDKARRERLGPDHEAIIARGGDAAKKRSGLPNFGNSPFGFVMRAMVTRSPINPDLRHAVLARAHLP
ncbi:hypothetical protein TeGR_g9274 [Tetraparma gracilis]|uniref:Uncharacterized protein n=1 Tax=Tetraparma gracilis TaxID=2962635 RepID=A0ABQ6MV63_9STRA|nr:hypothetical protein TeGR_g9274 [Tetraparma gracilis]